ncbi:hypothetical protein A2U01_0078786, partial [Trifolium medium]|nr:hypothetical protein [Trifolium medium]
AGCIALGAIAKPEWRIHSCQLRGAQVWLRWARVRCLFIG